MAIFANCSDRAFEEDGTSTAQKKSTRGLRQRSWGAQPGEHKDGGGVDEGLANVRLRVARMARVPRIGRSRTRMKHAVRGVSQSVPFPRRVKNRYRPETALDPWVAGIGMILLL